MKCQHCGAETDSNKRRCEYCDAELPVSGNTIIQNITINNNQTTNNNQQPPYGNYNPNFYNMPRAALKSPKSKGVAIVLCCCGFIGLGGLNRFYTGKTVSGVLYLLTMGLFLIGTIVDLVQLCNGTAKDAQGLPIL
jgi:restriction system protein